jgi:hypothetical protein
VKDSKRKIKKEAKKLKAKGIMPRSNIIFDNLINNDRDEERCRNT